MGPEGKVPVSVHVASGSHDLPWPRGSRLCPLISSVELREVAAPPSHAEVMPAESWAASRELGLESCARDCGFCPQDPRASRCSVWWPDWQTGSWTNRMWRGSREGSARVEASWGQPAGQARACLSAHPLGLLEGEDATPPAIPVLAVSRRTPGHGVKEDGGQASGICWSPRGDPLNSGPGKKRQRCVDVSTGQGGASAGPRCCRATLRGCCGRRARVSVH